MAWGRRSGMGRRRIARRLCAVRRASGRAAAILSAIGDRTVGGDRLWGRSFAAAAAAPLSCLEGSFMLHLGYVGFDDGGGDRRRVDVGGGSGGGVGWWRRVGPRQRWSVHLGLGRRRTGGGGCGHDRWLGSWVGWRGAGRGGRTVVGGGGGGCDAFERRLEAPLRLRRRGGRGVGREQGGGGVDWFGGGGSGRDRWWCLRAARGRAHLGTRPRHHQARRVGVDRLRWRLFHLGRWGRGRGG